MTAPANTGTILEPSVQSLYVQTLAGGQRLESATGFVVTHESQPYLITNWHVVAGRNPATGTARNPNGLTPDTLLVLQLKPRPGSLEWEAREESLRPDILRHWPWREHPVHGRNVDAVALPLTNVAGVELHPYDLQTPTRLAARVSEFVNIVGFPFRELGWRWTGHLDQGSDRVGARH